MTRVMWGRRDARAGWDPQVPLARWKPSVVKRPSLPVKRVTKVTKVTQDPQDPRAPEDSQGLVERWACLDSLAAKVCEVGKVT